ncbi:MAG: RHS repeat-associated core domain-containing protein [Terracidiphilus sp.]
MTLNGNPMYAYDAEGRRVAKLGSGGAVSTSYLLDLGGNQVTEFNASGAWAHSNVWAGGRLLATYDTSAGTDSVGYHFHLTDWLGTQRMQTTAAGNQEEVCYSYPFGDGLTCTGSDATEHHFTSKMRDTESGLDYFGARYLSSDLGRFMTPDWAGAPTAVPYATFGNPQTLNLYDYVENNPNTGIDLDGHFNDDSGNNLSDGSGVQSSCSGDACNDPYFQQSYFTGNSTGANGNPGTSDTPPKPAKPLAPNPEAQQQPNNTEVAQNNPPPPPGQNGQPTQPTVPTPQQQTKALIEKENKAFHQCVDDAAKGKAAVATSVATSAVQKESTAQAAVGAINAVLKADRECLWEHPYAALSTNYGYEKVVQPGDLGAMSLFDALN